MSDVTGRSVIVLRNFINADESVEEYYSIPSTELSRVKRLVADSKPEEARDMVRSIGKRIEPEFYVQYSSF